MTHPITTIVNFCSNDYPLVNHTLNQVKLFSKHIIATHSTHFYDGTLENQTLLNKTVGSHPTVLFVKFKYDPNRTHTIWRGWQYILRPFVKTKVFGPQYWICYARQLGLRNVPPDTNYVLFLDADEVPDGKRFKSWLDTKDYLNYNAIKPANYWYWRSPKHQALTYEDSPLLAKHATLKTATFMDHDERNATYRSISKPKIRIVLGLDKKPMIHHYGWAKPKKNLIKKVQTWGHSKDRNWEKLIQKEFQKPFSGTDFIYHRQFKTVKPFLVTKV